MVFKPPEVVDLPNGEAVCADHGLTVCGICCLDLTDLGLESTPEDGINSLIFDDIIEAGAEPDYEAGYGRVTIPKKFNPLRSSHTPQSLFAPGVGKNASSSASRFVRRTDNTELLIYTDGACLDNGQANPTGGCAFIYGDTSNRPETRSYESFGLEDKGPLREKHPQTSNRAELRAVIAALRFKHWTDEGWKSMVIATDSEYVVEGITNWVQRWIQNRWKTSQGKPVMNQDLWKVLLGEMEKWKTYKMKVQFWRIPRELNKDADSYAKEAALKVKKDREEAALSGRDVKPTEFADIYGDEVRRLVPNPFYGVQFESAA